jgi:hypothetical protein
MRIQTPLPDIKDQLITFIAEGFGILGEGFLNRYNSNISSMREAWEVRVVNYLNSVFPTKKEAGQFQYTPNTALLYSDMDSGVQDAVYRTEKRIQILESILDTLETYYQFEPESPRLFIQTIDSFSKVRGLNTAQVKSFLTNGFLDIPEDTVKTAFLEIIGQSYKPNDWGGETEDIYSSHLWLNGERVQASIILKGGGTIHGHETHLGDLGKNGDQLERMMRTSSTKLFIIQSVKPIGQDIINATQAFVSQHWANGNKCYFCIVEGQDTAMLLYAYGFLKETASPNS